MNIPKRIRIGAQWYSVYNEMKVDADSCYGQCRSAILGIFLSPVPPEPVRQQTFLHEVLHAISDQYRLKLKEEQVSMLANGLYQVIVDNPEVFNATQEG